MILLGVDRKEFRKESLKEALEESCTGPAHGGGRTRGVFRRLWLRPRLPGRYPVLTHRESRAEHHGISDLDLSHVR